MGLLRSAKGQSLVEFALVLGVLILMLMGIFDLGRAIYTYNVIANCAREGARAGIVDPTNVDAIVEAARSRAVALDADQLTVTVTQPGDNIIQVEVTYNFYAVTPLIAQFFGDGDCLTLRSIARMYIE
ncbi:MAG TPA: pilus assembly protein [Anaerolineae bacterium]|nr:pilus assembly protein [Anaerolineae bacterium]